ncbi:hypothetical protein BH23GEM3_BH23GEM3_21260 [soil metagenome]
MADPDSTSLDHLEHSKELIWEALQKLEDSQRALFRAGDCYVAHVWGDGVRAMLDIADRLTELSGDLTAVHIQIARFARRDRDREV